MVCYLENNENKCWNFGKSKEAIQNYEFSEISKLGDILHS